MQNDPTVQMHRHLLPAEEEEIVRFYREARAALQESWPTLEAAAETVNDTLRMASDLYAAYQFAKQEGQRLREALRASQEAVRKKYPPQNDNGLWRASLRQYERERSNIRIMLFVTSLAPMPSGLPHWEVFKGQVSPRTHAGLARQGITEPWQLYYLTDRELRGLRNVGPKTVREIRAVVGCRWDEREQQRLHERAGAITLSMLTAHGKADEQLALAQAKRDAW